MSQEITPQQHGGQPQYYSEFEPFDQYEDVFASTISPTLTPIQYPPPPTTFDWPVQLKTYIDELYRQGFHLRPRTHNPYFYTNGTMGNLGRESYEVYATRLPNHPSSNKAASPPNWESLFQVIWESKNPGKEYQTPKFATHSAFPTEKDSVVVISWFHAGPFACGPPGLAHGGLLSAVADTIMYETVLESERKAVTAGLTLSFKSPTPINSLVFIVASVELTGDRKAAARCALFNEDLSQLHVEATAVFVTPTAWVGIKEDLTYGIKNITKFDNTKPGEKKEVEEVKNVIDVEAAVNNAESPIAPGQ